MAEVAAASSAAGLISLGIQVCSGLYKYFSAYKDHDKDTTAVLRRIRSLSNLLEYLASTLRNPAFGDYGAARLVEDEILSCSEGIEELKKMQVKCTRKSDGTNSGSAAKQWHRALFPLRKSDLESLGRTLTHLQGNLNTALQILQMYGFEVPDATHTDLQPQRAAI